MNLNDRVSVNLTNHGMDVLAAHWAKYGMDCPTNRADGYYETELWALMHEFGAALHQGAQQVFHHNEIRVLP